MPRPMLRPATRRAAACLTAGLLLTVPALACTDVRLIAADGTPFTVRTMEFAADLQSDAVIMPRGRSFTSPGPKASGLDLDVEVRLRVYERLRPAGGHRRAQREGSRFRRALPAGRDRVRDGEGRRGRPRSLQHPVRGLGARQLRNRGRSARCGEGRPRVGRVRAAARLLLAAALFVPRRFRQKPRHRVRRRHRARLRQQDRRADQLADLRVAHPELAQLR